MAKVVRCLSCGRDNRIPDVESDRHGVFKCGVCREPIKYYAPTKNPLGDPDEAKKDKDSDDTEGEISKVLPVLCWSAGAMLFLMLGDWADDYYDIARLLTFGAAAYGLFLALQGASERWPWYWMLGGITLLYAPLMRLVFDRVPWIMIDCGAAVVLAFAPMYCRVPQVMPEAPEMTPEEQLRHADRSVG